MPDAFDPWHLVHVLWAAITSIVFWNGKQVIKRLDGLEEGKAEKDEVHDRHVENVTRFNEIIDRLNHLDASLIQHRNELNGSLNHMTREVTVLMERSRAALSREDREVFSQEEKERLATRKRP